MFITLTFDTLLSTSIESRVTHIQYTKIENLFSSMSCTKSKPLENKVLIERLLQKQGDSSIKLLDKSDEDEMVDTLVDAFLEDPMFQWMASIADSNHDKEGSMQALCHWTIKGMNRNVLRRKNGVVFGVMEGTKMAGAMSIIPSSLQPPGIFAWIMYAIFHAGKPPWEVNKKMYGKWTPKRIDSLGILAKKRKEIMKPYPGHIYLEQVGVRREFHGKGIGGKLFRMLFAAADSLNVPVYLETESEENETLYHHYGFQTTETVTLSAKGDTSADANFKMWLMVRHPH